MDAHMWQLRVTWLAAEPAANKPLCVGVRGSRPTYIMSPSSEFGIWANGRRPTSPGARYAVSNRCPPCLGGGCCLITNFGQVEVNRGKLNAKVWLYV